MNNFDIRSARLVAIVIGICLVFVLVVWNAFKFLPSDEDNIGQVKLPPNTEEIADNQDVSSEEDSTEEDVEEESDAVDQDELDEIKEAQLVKISETGEPIVVAEVENIDTVLDSAKNMVAEKKYADAISEYEKAADMTNDNYIKAECYEQIANLYGIVKRYGTALSYAQKAYNLVPSNSREVLLARVYYKTGSIDKANNLMQNVLKREFVQD